MLRNGNFVKRYKLGGEGRGVLCNENFGNFDKRYKLGIIIVKCIQIPAEV